jgi:TRAP-type C4-dicarboxylate transport system permease small subunit
MRITSVVENVIAVSLLCLAVVCGMLQVFSRYILANPMPWTEELARYAFIGTVFFGAVIAVRERQHVAMDLLLKSLPEKAKNIFGLLIPVVCLTIVVILLVSVPSLIISSLGSRSIVMSIPIVAVYSIWPISGSFMVIHLIDLCWGAWKKIQNEKNNFP